MKDSKIYKNRMLILLNVVLMTFMACLDSSIVNVALPVIARKLSVTMESVSWVVTSYLIVIAATILIFGRLGDIAGKTKIFKFGIALFTLGSLLCGISDSFLILVAARIIQAVGAAGTMATNQGIITQVFPDNERGRALGISGAFVALGALTGPPLGGFIVAVLSWKYIFLINVPIGIFTFILGTRILPQSDKNTDEKLDTRGAVLFVLAIVSLFGSLLEGQDIGYSRPIIILGFAVAAISLTIFILVEKRIEVPLLQLTIFENTLFSLSIFCGFISFVAISCPNIIQPFYLQETLKLSPATTGLLMMASPLILTVVAPASGYLSDKIGSEFLTLLGLMCTSAGLFLMSTFNERSSLSTIVAFIAVMSVGNGMFQSPNNSLIMSTVPRNRLGIAGSINALIRNLGMVFGISLSTTLLYNRMSDKLGYHVVNYVHGREDAFIYGMRCVYITAAVICLAGALLTGYRLYGKKMGMRGTEEKLYET
ncbi:MAG: MFS transporter [Clostridiales bacterium]|nr:MFS transporter [Eubacteriales bacterium]MDH7567246.1 MFS transporter [Clostridiales bacterium]